MGSSPLPLISASGRRFTPSGVVRRMPESRTVVSSARMNSLPAIFWESSGPRSLSVASTGISLSP